MTDTAPENVDDTTDAEADGNESPVINQLRKDLAEARKAAIELDALKRERAFDKAGIPEDGAGKWFRKGYEGELDPEAIKSAAVSDGLIDVNTDADSPEAQEAAAAAAGADRIAEAASEGGQPQPTVDALIAKAETVEEIDRIMADAGLGMRPT